MNNPRSPSTQGGSPLEAPSAPSSTLTATSTALSDDQGAEQVSPLASVTALIEAELSAVFVGLPLSISVVDPQGTILFVNQKDPAISKQLVGMSAFALTKPAYHEEMKRVLEHVFRTEQPMNYVAEAAGRDGGNAWYDVHVGPMQLSGEVRALSIAAVDITARKREEKLRRESEERLRALVDSLPGFIFTIDKERRITWINRAPTGFREEQVIGASAFDFMMPNYREVAQRAITKSFETGEATSYEMAGLPKSIGTTTESGWYAVYAGPILHDGEVIALTLAAEDITARKRLEKKLRESMEQLKSYAEELEEKNRQLAAENAERERTEAALHKQREVVSALGTPIIQAWEGVLALPIVGSLDSARASQIMEKLLGEIVRTRARFAVLDLTGVEAVDTSTVSHLFSIVRAASLLGSRCLVSGISPAIAQTMASIGIGMEAFLTFGQMQDALRFALAQEGVRSVGRG